MPGSGRALRRTRLYADVIERGGAWLTTAFLERRAARRHHVTAEYSATALKCRVCRRVAHSNGWGTGKGKEKEKGALRVGSPV